MRYLITFVMIFVIQSLMAQIENSYNNAGIMLRAIKVGDTVKLRWTPANIDIWENGNKYGYKLIRRSINGTMTLEEEMKSTVVLVDTLKPLGLTAWESSFGNNEKAGLTKNILYNDSLKYQYDAHPDSIRLVDVVKYKTNEDSRFVFALMLGEQDYDIAKALALAYDDTDVEPNTQYIYTVKVNKAPGDSVLYKAGTVRISLGDSFDLPSPQELTAAGGDHNVLLSWRIKDIEQYYTYYNIERAISGIDSFYVVNDLPFIYIDDEESNGEYAFYSDTIEDNNTEYIYRIIGISPFGMYGPPSDTVHVQGKEPRLDFSISIDTAYADDTGMFMKWKIFPESVREQIVQFNILSKTRIDDTSGIVNTTPISNSDSTFAKEMSVQAAYYTVEAIDKNDYHYSSIAILLQMPDTIPPVKPTGLTGSIRDDGKVVIDWDANTEEDLKGYKVVYSNALNGEYSQLTTVALARPHFEDYIDPRLMVDSIYFKVFAVDQRYNMSELSEPLALERPDIVAPSEPVIKKLVSSRKGIAVFWSLSESADVVKYELQRKIANTPTWEKVLGFDAGNEPVAVSSTNPLVNGADYLDTDTLHFNTYKYRLLAYDEKGNIAYSKEKSVFPYDVNIRGEIMDFKGVMIPYMPIADYIEFSTVIASDSDVTEDDTDNTTNENEEINISVGENADELVPTSNTSLDASDLNKFKRVVALSWKYKTVFDNLKCFKLYRRIVFQQYVNSAGNIFEENINHADFVLIKSIDPNVARSLAQKVGFSGYLFIDDYPQSGAVHYEYKLKAEHYDGGRSRFSDIVTIRTFD